MSLNSMISLDRLAAPPTEFSVLTEDYVLDSTLEFQDTPIELIKVDVIPYYTYQAQDQAQKLAFQEILKSPIEYKELPIEDPKHSKKKLLSSTSIPNNSVKEYSKNPKTVLLKQIKQLSELAKFISFRSNTTYILLNFGKKFLWCDLYTRPKAPLTQVTFDSIITCHDLNRINQDNPDCLLGLQSGDIFCINIISGKFYHFNKNGLINKTQGSEHIFLVSHLDGTVITYDKEKEESSFTPLIPTSEQHSFIVPLTFQPQKKCNPIGWWSFGGKNSHVTSFSFSPDLKTVACCTINGFLRLIDIQTERCMQTFSSFFGGILCHCFSNDGNFLVTGGQDDLISIYYQNPTTLEYQLIQRGEGHSSFVRSVQFDTYIENNLRKGLRLGSVGEDGRILFWEIKHGNFHLSRNYSTKNKNLHDTSGRSILRESKKENNGPSSPPGVGGDGKVDSFKGKNDVKILVPIASHKISFEALYCISFIKTAIITTDRRGEIKIWNRPTEKKK
ncbi:hypothetical protein HDU92_003009 [Lobulomyces angularis]|nr:hypothetical protein HDU92_003009 [Lobulomyces angularis]